MTASRSTVIPGHRYRNAPAAIDWLCQVFGFERHAVYEGENGTIAHAELTLGNGMIMLGTGKDDEFGRGFKSPQELGGDRNPQRLPRGSRRRRGPCPRRCRRSNHHPPAPGHPLRQPRVRRERPRRTFVESQAPMIRGRPGGSLSSQVQNLTGSFHSWGQKRSLLDRSCDIVVA